MVSLTQYMPTCGTCTMRCSEPVARPRDDRLPSRVLFLANYNMFAHYSTRDWTIFSLESFLITVIFLFTFEVVDVWV